MSFIFAPQRTLFLLIASATRGLIALNRRSAFSSAESAFGPAVHVSLMMRSCLPPPGAIGIPFAPP